MIPELACRQGEKHKLQTGKAGLLSENWARTLFHLWDKYVW
jgi:hypothetical protein